MFPRVNRVSVDMAWGSCSFGGGDIAEGHNGAVSGFSAALYMNRAAGVAVVVLASAVGDGAVDVGELALQALDALSK